MKRWWLLSLPAGILLSSATPPPSPATQPFETATFEEEPPCDTCDEAGMVEALRLLEPEPMLEYDERVLATAAPEPPRVEREEPKPSFAKAESVAPASVPSGVRVVVSIPLQKAYVFDDGELIATSPVSTGKRGHETPAGRFRILQKKVHHRSSKYDNAPMPYMQRLTNYGIALHAGRLPGYPASHGCIRLPWGFAKKLYNLTDHGTKVTITKRKPKSASEALALA